MQTALPLSAFVKSDIALSVRFDSSEITLDDLQAVLQLLGAVADAAQSEISDSHGEFVLLPVVTVSGGSFRIRIDFKASRWTVLGVSAASPVASSSFTARSEALAS